MTRRTDSIKHPDTNCHDYPGKTTNLAIDCYTIYYLERLVLSAYMIARTNHYSQAINIIPNLPRTRHTNYLNSFLCKGPRSILSLNVETINKPNLHAFTKACKKLLLNKMST